MAFTPLVPVTGNISVRRGYASSLTLPAVKSPGGTAIDFTTWNSLSGAVINNNQSMPAQNLILSSTTSNVPTGTNQGVLSLKIDGDFTTTTPAGNCQLIISGTAASGDDPQLLATVGVTVS